MLIGLLENLTDDITYREIRLYEYYESMESYINLIMTSLEDELKLNRNRRPPTMAKNTLKTYFRLGR
jgi:hypothetical protein